MNNNNDVFSQHDIDHLSPSSINAYISDPCKWVMKYLFKSPRSSGPGAWRGTVVDECVGLYLAMEKPDVSKVTDVAMRRFKALTEANEKDPHDDKVSKERHLVPRYIQTACDYFHDFGQPEAYQKEVSVDVGLPVPIIGFIDLKYQGIVRDIKTVGRMPSAIPEPVNRQLSLYAHAESSDAIVDYINVTSTKAEVRSIEVENVELHFDNLVAGARSIERLLTLGDKNEIAKLFFPNLDSSHFRFPWSDEEKEFAQSIWR